MKSAKNMFPLKPCFTWEGSTDGCGILWHNVFRLILLAKCLNDVLLPYSRNIERTVYNM